MSDVALPESLGHQHFDGSTNQLVSPIAEEVFDLRIGQCNLTGAVNGYQRVRRGLEELTDAQANMLERPGWCGRGIQNASARWTLRAGCFGASTFT